MDFPRIVQGINFKLECFLMYLRQTSDPNFCWNKRNKDTAELYVVKSWISYIQDNSDLF